MNEHTRRTRATTAAALAAVVLLAASPASAQWIERELDLDAGWSSVWLDVQPSESSVDDVLDGLDWESIWTRSPDPDRPGVERWLSARRDGPALLRTLESVRAPKAYLIEMRSAGTLTVVGSPARRDAELRGSDHTLLGADVDPVNRPSFDEVLTRPNVAGSVTDVHGLVGGRVERLSPGDRVAPGQAFWLFASRDSRSVPPIAPELGRSIVTFGASDSTAELEVDIVPRPFPTVLLVRAQPTAPPPEGEAPDLSGGALDWLELQDEDGDFGSLDDTVSVGVPANATKVKLRFRCLRRPVPRRVGPGAGIGQGTNQAVLELTDVDGNRLTVGVTMRFPSVDGVWVGSLRLDRVSTHSSFGAAVEPSPAQLFSARLILEFPVGEPPRLLDRVALPGDHDSRSVAQTLTALLFTEPVPLAGVIDATAASGELEAIVAMPADHPLNPYRHRYNPEHRAGVAFTRSLRLTFDESAPSVLEGEEFEALRTTLRSGAIAGHYAETIEGIAAEPIEVRGTFELRRLTGELAVQQ